MNGWRRKLSFCWVLTGVIYAASIDLEWAWIIKTNTIRIVRYLFSFTALSWAPLISWNKLNSLLVYYNSSSLILWIYRNKTTAIVHNSAAKTSPMNCE